MPSTAVNWHVLVFTTFILGLCAIPAGAASPSSDGLVLWLDATDVDGDGDAANQPAVGSPLERWHDKSGAGNHVGQSEGAQRPTVERGSFGDRQVIRFHGDDLLSRETFAGFVYRDQPIHVVIVMQTSASGAHTMPRLLEFQPVDGDLSKPATVKQHGFWIGPRGDGRMRLATHYGDEGAARPVAWDARPHVVEVVYAGAQNWVHYFDGARDGAGLLGDRDFHGFTKDVRLAIGQHYGFSESDTFFEGDLAEVLVYNRSLGAAEQNALKAYLSQKWSLDLSIEPVPHFERDVEPILAQYCHECHGEDLQEADVDLRTLAGMLRGGKSGPVIARRHPEFSDVMELIVRGEMPPDGAEPPTAKEIATIRRWIEAGAPADELIGTAPTDQLVSEEDRQFWAYQPLIRHEPPQANNTDRVRTPIDAFVLGELEPLGLSFAEDAAAAGRYCDARILISLVCRRRQMKSSGSSPTRARQHTRS